ncbi:MAG: type II toxin-antitoxin system ParD family antitoxin [Hyphomicrobiales bacterium]
MSRIERRTISLPPESAAYIDELVAAGRFASVSEVVRAGLAALREREAAVERWLAAEVAAGRLTADPE